MHIYIYQYININVYMYLILFHLSRKTLMLPPAGLFHELGYVIIHVYVSPLYVYLPTGVKVKHVVL